MTDTAEPDRRSSRTTLRLAHADTCWTRVETPVGPMLLVSDGNALTGAYFDGQKYHPEVATHWRRDDDAPVLVAARLQLLEYASGRRAAFELPLAPRGTQFQQAVWRALCALPFGSTVSYSELSRRCGAAHAVRAVGTAVGRNPISVFVPCHRVLGLDGTLTGYAGGLDRKRMLLALEGVAHR